MKDFEASNINNKMQTYAKNLALELNADEYAAALGVYLNIVENLLMDYSVGEIEKRFSYMFKGEKK